MASKTRNPHDRRDPQQTDEPLQSYGLLGSARRVALTFDDLEVLAGNIVEREVSSALRKLEDRHGKQLAVVRHREWEAGHRAGTTDGAREARDAALRLVDRRPKILESTAELLGKAEFDDDNKMTLSKVTKDQLYRQLDSLYDLLGELVSELEGSTARPQLTALEAEIRDVVASVPGVSFGAFAKGPATGSAAMGAGGVAKRA